MNRTIERTSLVACFLAGLALAGCAKKIGQTATAGKAASTGASAKSSTRLGPKVVSPIKRDESTRVRVVRAFRDWGVRETAADSLGRIGDAAVPALVAALEDADRDVRAQATRALARMGPKAEDAIPALIDALDDDDKEVRRGAARALGQIGPLAEEAVPALVQALKDPRNKATEQAVETEIEEDDAP